MKATIIYNNGQVLVVKADNQGLPKDNSYSLTSVNGVDIMHLNNSTMFINTYEMEDKESMQLVKDVAEALVSEEGTVTFLDPVNNKKSLKKRLSK